MADRFFPLDTFVSAGFTEAELLALRLKVKTELQNDPGRQLVSVTTDSLSSAYVITASPAEILAAIKYALSLIDPSLYGQIATRTRADFL